MKFQELNENEPLKVVEVSQHIKRPNLNSKDNAGSHVMEVKRIQTKIFTDGEIAKESEEVSENIQEYYFGEEKYEHDVDTLKTKNIFFKNYSFVITYVTAKKWTTIGNVGGWFDIIKDVSIYLKNSKDRNALRNAKKVIKEIQSRNESANYSSLSAMLFSKGQDFGQFDKEKISENVYSVTIRSR